MKADNHQQLPASSSAARPVLWPIFLELAPFAVIPFVIWWSKTPTNILSSYPYWRLLEAVGLYGIALLYVFEIPVGLIGIRASKKMTKLRLAVKTLSIVHLAIGAIMVGLTVYLFLQIILGNISH